MKHLLKAVAFAGLLAATGAQAAGEGGYKDEPVVAATWWQAGDVFVRVRGEALIPETSTESWSASHASNLGHLVSSPDLSVDTVGLAELDLSYFFTKNLAVELICCVAQTSIRGAGSLGTVGKVGDTWLFPPTLLLQYHFDTFGPLKPYVGAGVNYTVFFDENATQPTFRNLKIENAWGAAVQVGADYHLAGNWFLNVDAKQIFLSTDFSVDVPSAYSHVTGHININPTIVGAGIGYRFGALYEPLPLK